MSTGRCLRCGRLGPVEADHPDGRHYGLPLWPDVTAPLCRGCHLTKGRIDRATGVEGGPVTAQLMLRRRAAWCVFLATSGTVIMMPAWVLADFAEVLADVAHAIPPDLPLRVRE